MKTFLIAATLAGLAMPMAVSAEASRTSGGATSVDGLFDGTFDRRRPRVPGGSGCDTPRDILEHPECTPTP